MSTSDLGYNRDLATQIGCLKRLLGGNATVREILRRAPSLNLPNWYLGAGCIAQTVWNAFHGFEPTFGIKDYDLVFFEPSDLSPDAEAAQAERAKDLLKDLDARVDVKNEARVHLWYADRFGYAISPYESVEHAINTWPTTATSIGVRTKGDESLIIYAPFGLNDLLGMIVRANKAQITQTIYEEKAQRWLALWPRLRKIEWDE